MSKRRPLFLPAALALGAALALTACGPNEVTRDPQPANQTRPAGAPAPEAPAPGSGASDPGTPSARGSAAPSRPAANPTATAAPAGGTTKGSGGSDDDAYAYTHPCESKNLTVRVTPRSEAPGQRVIAVRNQGPRACGLSYFPLVSLGDSHAADHTKDVKPLLPGGLGGAPSYPVAAGQTAYAVLDLNPAGATTGTAPGIDQLDVLADGDHMPNADTVNFPLGPGAKVFKPRLGLYRGNVAEAAASAATADRPS